MLTPEEFPILPWGWTPGDPKLLREIADCGFNLAGFVSPEDLDRASAAGLKAIVSDPSAHVGDEEAALPDEEIRRRTEALACRAKDHPAVFGYYLRDEPSAKVFPGLGRWAAALQRADPDHAPYMNLFPNYASPEQLGVATYQEYLEEYVRIVKPPFISYDHYALMEGGTLRDGFYQNLEAVRAVALKSGLPFWNIVLSNAHFHYSEPTPAGFRFQLYATLAHGGRGICYFTYFAPESGNYRLAPIDQFGNKTPTWEMLRNVNLQLHKIGPTYLQLKSVNVFHRSDAPHDGADLKASRHLSELKGDPLLVGEFDGPGGSPYAMIVNEDLHRSVWFDARFKKAGRIHQVNSYTGESQPWVGENNFLAAGQGMLLHLEE